MTVNALKISNRRLWMHKGVLDADFETEHVLSNDPWQYVELWLRRENKPDALSYWTQARRFADASRSLSPEAAPLTLYYSFLNATKALLITKGVNSGAHHGVAGVRPENAKASLSNEQVSFKSGGVLPALCSLMNEGNQEATYALKDILWNIPFIHRAFRLTFRTATDLFIPLERARYVRKGSTREAHFEAQVLARFADGRALSNIPASFESFDRGDLKFVRRRKQFQWHKGRASKAEKSRAVDRLRHYHAVTRRVIVNISGNRDLWYLKRYQAQNLLGGRHTLVLMFAAMHRLSELSRYDPSGFDKHLAGQANWLLTEFISGATDQFVDQISTEITGCQFWPPKTR